MFDGPLEISDNDMISPNILAEVLECFWQVNSDGISDHYVILLRLRSSNNIAVEPETFRNWSTKNAN